MTATIAISRASAAHYLNRVAFGPRPGDLDRTCSRGIDDDLEAQLAGNLPEPTVTAYLEKVATIRYSPSEIVIRHQRDKESRASVECILDDLRSAKLFRAIESPNQLAEVMTDFWYNHFNVYVYAWEPSVPDYERLTIRPNALGSFPDLLHAVAKSPAMTYYLDTYLNTADRVEEGKLVKGINENYGRELLELHTVGVKAGYTQHDVYEAARCFTGWDFGGWSAPVYEFRFSAGKHDQNPKTVFGKGLEAGSKDGEQLLDYLATHPKTAEFISWKLVQRFVSDDPPQTLVAKSANVFRRTDGSIRDVLRCILTSEEFRSDAVMRRKTKTPFEFAVSAVRATNGSLTDGKPLATAIGAMGMPLYECKPPIGYSNRSSDWVNVSSQLLRFNFAFALAAGKFPGVTIPPVSGGPSTFAHEVLGQPLSRATVDAIGKISANGNVPAPVKVHSLILASPEFQVR